jgi:hypothetical protein
MPTKIQVSASMVIVLLLVVATSAPATVVTTSMSFRRDKIARATVDANDFELTVSVTNPKVLDSSGGVFQQDVKQAGLGNGTRFT